ncbi:MAG: ROK family transcriptional regulator [Firmicutes bacterium]|nr:ROK family transcriptional regulator [Bacillota bacterium]
MEQPFMGNPSLMKKINLSMVLELIKTRGPISRADIARELGLSPPTVSSLVKSLLEDNLVVEIGLSPSSIGKRATLLKYNPSAGFAVGVYLDGTKMLLGVTDLAGQTVTRSELPVNGSSLKPEEVLTAIRDIVNDVQKTSGVDGNELKGIGMAVAAVTDAATGTILSARYLGALVGFPFKTMLEKSFNVRAYVDNDVYMGALGEKLYGKGRNSENMLFVTVGEGIGVGIILGNRLYRGAHHGAGEMGDMIIERSLIDERGPQGGHLERLCGWDAITEMAKERLKSGKKSLINETSGGKVSADLVHEAARRGDEVALEIVQEVSRNLAIGIANVASILDPDLVVLGGDILSAMDLYLDRIKEELFKILPRLPRIEASELGRNAELLGAAGMAINQMNPLIVVRPGEVVGT